MHNFDVKVHEKVISKSPPSIKPIRVKFSGEGEMDTNPRKDENCTNLATVKDEECILTRMMVLSNCYGVWIPPNSIFKSVTAVKIPWKRIP